MVPKRQADHDALQPLLGPALPRAAAVKAANNGAVNLAMAERALAEGRIVAAYQPVVDARDLRRISFFEGLIRLRTPGGTLLAPAQFMPAAAGTPLASALDREMLRLGLAALRRTPRLRLALNVAAHTLEDGVWMDHLIAAVEAAPDVGYRLILELSEAPGTLDHPDCRSFVAAVQSRGISVALDDFGAGATGFNHFRRFRFDIVKIDGSYGDGLHRDADSRALVRALTGIARHFEMLTVLEHVDTQLDAQCALDLGVDALQGYLFGRPNDTPKLAT